MGRKKIHDSNSAKYKAYRLRKEDNGRFVRLFIPREIDVELNLKGNPGRAIELAVQTEEMKNELKLTLYDFLNTVVESLTILSKNKDEIIQRSTMDIISHYFDRIGQRIHACTSLRVFEKSELSFQLRFYVKRYRTLLKDLRARLDPELYNSLSDAIRTINEWAEE